MALIKLSMKDPRMVKGIAVMVALGYCILVLYQGGVFFKQTQNTAKKRTEVKYDPNDSSFSDITLDDIFISVKTSKKFFKKRVTVILRTWFQLAKEQTWFFTDKSSDFLQNLTGGHVISTTCHSAHNIVDLCCKTAVEFYYYFQSDLKWFCHFDDDNYVNIPRLLKNLQSRDYRRDWYIGKTSIKVPKKTRRAIGKGKFVYSTFKFATGGAGYCISKNLARKMYRYMSAGKYVYICRATRQSDDVTIGYIIEHKLKTNLTINPAFHSHLEPLKLIPLESFHQQISFSYKQNNTINIPGFEEVDDPTRFYSLHCFLFPDKCS